MRNIRDKLAPRIVQTALLGDIVDNRDHAALAVQRTIRRKRNRQHTPAARDLAGQKAAHGSLVRADHIQIGKHLVKGHVAAHAHAEQALGRRVHVDQLALGREGSHAVGHMQEQGVQLIALALHLAHRAFQAAGHVVKRARQLADLVGRLHAQILIEVAFRDRARALGDAFDRVGDRLAEQEGQQDRRKQAEHHRLHNDLEEAPRQVGDLAFIVGNVNDIVDRAVALLVDRDGNVHHAVRHGRTRANLARHRRDDIARARQRDIRVGAFEIAPLGVQNIVVSIIVDAKRALPRRNDLLQAGRALFSRGVMQGLHRAGLVEHVLHLLIKAVQIEGADAVDQECAYYGHDRNDHQHQNQHQLHV